MMCGITLALCTQLDAVGSLWTAVSRFVVLTHDGVQLRLQLLGWWGVHHFSPGSRNIMSREPWDAASQQLLSHEMRVSRLFLP